MEEESHQREPRRRGSASIDAVGVDCWQGAMEEKLGKGLPPRPRMSLPCRLGCSSSRVRPLSIVTFASAVGLVASPSLSAVDGSCGMIFFLFIYLIYLFLAALGLRCCTRAFSSCGERGLLFVVVHGLLTGVASLIVEHGL